MRQHISQARVGALNIKLLLLISIVGMSLVGGLGGAYYFLVLRSATAIHQKAKQLEAAGQLREARRNYGRALGKEPRDLGYLTDLQRTILLTSPGSRVEANEFYSFWIGSLKWGAENHPELTERSRALVQAVYSDAKASRSSSLMEMVEEIADASGVRNVDNEVFAERWVAVSRLNRVRWSELKSRDRDEAFELIQNRLEDNPLAIDYGIALGAWSLRLEEAVLDNDRSYILEYAGKLREIFDASSTADVPSQGSERLLASHARSLVGEAFALPVPENGVGHGRSLWLIGRLHAAKALNSDRVQEICPEVQVSDGSLRERAILELPLMMEISDIQECYRSLSVMGEPDLTAQLVQAFRNLQGFSDAPYFVEQNLAEILSQSTEEQDRIGASKVVADFMSRERPKTGLFAASFDDLRLSMYRIQVGLVMDQLVRGSLDREDAVEQIASLRSEAQAFVTDPDSNLVFLEIKAKEAYARNTKQSLRESAKIFDDILRSQNLAGGAPNVRLLLYSVQVNRELDQIGLALRQLDQALDQVPNEPTLLQNKLQLLILNREWENVVALGQAMVDADIVADIAFEAIQGAKDALNGGGPSSPLETQVRDVALRFDSGEYENALLEMSDLYSRFPEEFRVVNTYVRMLVANNQNERALEVMDGFASSSPRVDEIFRELRSIASTSDPIDAIVLFHTSDKGLNEPERAVAILRGLKGILGSSKSSSDDSLGQRIQDEIKKRSDAASINFPDDPGFIEFQFVDAIVAEDWSSAESLVERAVQDDLDQASGYTYRGRLAAARRDWVGARDAFSSATEEIPTDGQILAQLAQSEANLGEYANAERHFVEAWEIQSNSVSIGRSYATLLVQLGKYEEAVDVLRTASRLSPSNIAIREAWLNIALRAGDTLELLRVRASRYSVNPDDTQNTLEFARLLATTTPSVESAILLNPEFPYTPARFNQLSAARQNALLAEAQKVWMSRSDNLLDQLRAKDDDGKTLLLINAYKAEILKDQGQAQEAIGLLLQEMSQAENQESKLMTRLLAAQMYSGIGQFRKAVETLSYPDGQTPDQSALFASAAILMANNQFANAADVYAELIALLPDEGLGKTLQLLRPNTFRPGLDKFELPQYAILEQYAECLARSNRTDEAQVVLDGLPQTEDTRDLASRSLVQALIYAGVSEKKFRSDEDGSSEEALALQVLAESKELLPQDVGPRLLEASILTERYRRVGTRESYDEASAAVASAEALAPNSPAVSTARFQLLGAGGERAEAIRTLVGQLERTPKNDVLRSRIIRQYLQLGDRVAAASVASSGADAYPSGKRSADWLSQAGELLTGVTGQIVQAREYLRNAFDQDPNEARFARRMASEVAVPSPDWQLIIRFTAKEKAWVQDNPDLLSMRAKALLENGREQESRKVLRECYVAFERQVSNGAPKMGMARFPLQLSTYFGSGRSAEIARFAREVSGADSLSWPLLNGLARVKLTEKDFDGAIEDAQQSAKLAEDLNDPEAFQVWLAAGNIAIAADQPETAISAWRKSLSLKPDQPLTANNIAYILSVNLGEHQQALPLAEQAVAANPTNPTILDTLGSVQLALGDTQAARQTLAQAIRRGAGAMTHVRYALALAKDGDAQQAGSVLASAKNRDDAEGDEFEAMILEVESILSP